MLRGRVQGVLNLIIRQQIQERRRNKLSLHVTAPTCVCARFSTILNISKVFLWPASNGRKRCWFKLWQQILRFPSARFARDEKAAAAAPLRRHICHRQPPRPLPGQAEPSAAAAAAPGAASSGTTSAAGGAAPRAAAAQGCLFSATRELSRSSPAGEGPVRGREGAPWSRSPLPRPVSPRLGWALRSAPGQPAAPPTPAGRPRGTSGGVTYRPRGSAGPRRTTSGW